MDVTQLCFKFYLEIWQILSFDENYKSKNIVLSDQNKCAKKLSNDGDYCYFMAKTVPIFKGLHCFRVKIKAKDTAWIMFGFGEYRKYKDRSYTEGRSPAFKKKKLCIRS